MVGGGGVGLLDDFVGDGVEVAVAEVEALRFGVIEGTSTAAAKDGELVAGFIDGPVAIYAFRDGKGWTFGACGGDELESGARTESGEVRGVVPWRKNLQDTKAVFAVGDEGEGGGGDHADFHVVDIVELTIGGEKLFKFGCGGIFHIDESESLLSGGNVSVGASGINVATVGERNQGICDGRGMSEIGDVENLHSVVVDEEGIAELDGDGARVIKEGRGESGGDFGNERVIEIDDDERFVGEDIGVIARNGDAASAGESAVGIEGESALQKIVGGTAVEQCTDSRAFCFQVGIANDDETFFLISDIEKTIEKMNGLLFIFRETST